MSYDRWHLQNNEYLTSDRICKRLRSPGIDSATTKAGDSLELIYGLLKVYKFRLIARSVQQLTQNIFLSSKLAMLIRKNGQMYCMYVPCIHTNALNASKNTEGQPGKKKSVMPGYPRRHGWLHALYAVRSIGENCLRQVTVHGELSNPRHSAAVTWIFVPRMQLREQSTGFY
jgi:hypothetical protein